MKTIAISFAALASLMAAHHAVGSHGVKLGKVAPLEAVSKLKAGNIRFVQGASENPHQDSGHREIVARGQKPYAVVLTCADSRVSPEILFDQGLGDLFVCRVAGNTADESVMGSIEYAVEHLGSRLVVVLGHEKCGAVEAAMKGGHLPGSIGAVVKPIQPAVKRAAKMPGDYFKTSVIENVRGQVAHIKQHSHIVKKMIGEGKMRVVGAYYDLDDGRVSWVQ